MVTINIPFMKAMRFHEYSDLDVRETRVPRALERRAIAARTEPWRWKWQRLRLPSSTNRFNVGASNAYRPICKRRKDSR